MNFKREMFVAEQKKAHHEISFLLLKLFECSAHKMLYTHQTKTQPVSKTFPRITILIINLHVKKMNLNRYEPEEYTLSFHREP